MKLLIDLHNLLQSVSWFAILVILLANLAMDPQNTIFKTWIHLPSLVTFYQVV